MKRILPAIAALILLSITAYAGYELFAAPSRLLNYDDEMEFLIITLFLCISLSFGTMVICVMEVISMKSVSKRLNALQDEISHLNNRDPL